MAGVGRSATVESGGRDQLRLRLHLCLLGDLECIVYLEPEVADGALKFRVSEEKLERPGDFWSFDRSGRLSAA